MNKGITRSVVSTLFGLVVGISGIFVLSIGLLSGEGPTAVWGAALITIGSIIVREENGC